MLEPQPPSPLRVEPLITTTRLYARSFYLKKVDGKRLQKYNKACDNDLTAGQLKSEFDFKFRHTCVYMFWALNMSILNLVPEWARSMVSAFVAEVYSLTVFCGHLENFMNSFGGSTERL